MICNEYLNSWKFTLWKMHKKRFRKIQLSKKKKSKSLSDKSNKSFRSKTDSKLKTRFKKQLKSLNPNFDWKKAMRVGFLMKAPGFKIKFWSKCKMISLKKINTFNSYKINSKFQKWRRTYSKKNWKKFNKD